MRPAQGLPSPAGELGESSVLMGEPKQRRPEKRPAEGVAGGADDDRQNDEAAAGQRFLMGVQAHQSELKR